MEKEVRKTLQQIEHEIIAITNESDVESLFWNPLLAELFSERKTMINNCFEFNNETIEEIKQANSRLAQMEQSTRDYADKFLTFCSIETSEVADFEVSAFVDYHRTLFDVELYNQKLDVQIIEALELHHRPCLCSYHYVSDEKHIFALSNDWLAGTPTAANGVNKNSRFEEAFGDTPFCRVWSVLHDHTYYSLSDIVLLNSFGIQINQHLNFVL